jgi:hypothetical protein
MKKAADDLTSLKIEMNNIERSFEYLRVINILFMVLFFVILPFGIINASPVDNWFVLYTVSWIAFLTGHLYWKYKFLWPRCKEHMKTHDVVHSKRILFWDTISMIFIVGMVFGTSAFLFEDFEPMWFWEMFIIGIFLSSFYIGLFYPTSTRLQKKSAIEERKRIINIFLGMIDEMTRRENSITKKKERLDELDGNLDINSVTLPWRVKHSTSTINIQNSSGLGEGYARSKFIKRLHRMMDAKVKNSKLKEVDRFINIDVEYFRFKSLDNLAKKLFMDLKEILKYLDDLEFAYDEAIRIKSQPKFADMVPVIRDKIV